MRRKLAYASVAGLVIAGIGLGLLLFIGNPVSATTLWVVIFVITLLGLIGGVITGVFAFVFPLFGAGASQAALAEAAQAGREGFARVLTAKPTGAKINNFFVYDADLVVDQTRVPAYQVTDRIRVNRLEGVLRGGEILTVVRVNDDGPRVVVVGGPSRTPQDAMVPTDAPPWA